MSYCDRDTRCISNRSATEAGNVEAGQQDGEELKHCYIVVIIDLLFGVSVKSKCLFNYTVVSIVVFWQLCTCRCQKAKLQVLEMA